MIVAPVEVERYLDESLSLLCDFCDEVRVVVDGSCDSPAMDIVRRDNVSALCDPPTAFYAHEGRARQHLLDWTLAAHPTHILSIDADEFVSDGDALRQAIESSTATNVWMLNMMEVWRADERRLHVRVDGAWKPHPTCCVYRADLPQMRIADRALACGREPEIIRRYFREAKPSGVDIFHFGWANPTERQTRYDRYVEHDGGNFHARQHLDSIMWPDKRVRTHPYVWPKSLEQARDRILHLANVPR
jgi:hypothetical protein